MNINARLVTAAAFALAVSAACADGEPRTLYYCGQGGAAWNPASTKVFKLNNEGDNIAWIDDGLSIYRCANLNSQVSYSFTAYGLQLIHDNSSSYSYSINADKVVTLGAGGIYVEKTGDYNGSPRMQYGEGAFHLAASQTWRCVVAAATTAPAYFDLSNLDVTAVDGITWTFSGKTYATFNRTHDFSNMAEIRLESPSTMRLLADASLNANLLTVSGAGNILTNWITSARAGGYALAETLALADGAGIVFTTNSVADIATLCATSGVGTVSGAFKPVRDIAVVVADGATLNIATDAVYPDCIDRSLAVSGSGAFVVQSGHVRVSSFSGFSGTVAVTDGTLQIPSTDILPSGLTVAVSGTGAVVVETVTGDEGTKVSGRWSALVTDTPRTEALITLKEGDVLHVQGDGLTAATEVKLDGGTLSFERNATVASKLYVPTNAAIAAVEGVHGLVTGFIDGSNTYMAALWPAWNEGKYSIYTLNVTGKGDVILAGGGSFNAVSLYAYDGGSVTVATNTMTITRARCGLPNAASHQGHYFGIKNGGRINMPWTSGGGMFFQYICSRTKAHEDVFEIGEGGTLHLGGNHGFYFNGNYGKLLINGGRLRFASSGVFYSYGTGNLIEMRSGLVETSQIISFNNTWHDMMLDWYGGTWRILTTTEGRLNSSDGTWPTTRDGAFPRSTLMSIRIAGPDCVLDAGGKDEFKIENTSGAEMMKPGDIKWSSAGDAACLTLTNCGNFVVNGFPTGTTLRAACPVTCDSNVTVLAKAALASTNASVSVAEGFALEVTNLTVAAEGRWSAVSVGSGVSVENLAFEADATFAYAANDPVFSISGMLSLPYSLRTEVADVSQPYEVIRAGSIDGSSSEFTALPGTRKCKLSVHGNSLICHGRGLSICFR